MTTLARGPSRTVSVSFLKLLSYLVLGVGAVIILIPFIWMVSTSLKPATELFIYPPRLFPSVIRWQNYIEAPNSSLIPMGQAVGNSLRFAIPVAFFDVFTSALVAFAFARIRFRGSNVLFFIVISTMMLPPQVTMIPLFILFSRLGWINTYLPLVVQAIFGWNYAIFLLRQFFASIPEELDNAARIDGCGWWGIFYRIHLPLAKAALGVVAIFSFTGSWSEYLRPLIYLRDPTLWPLALALQTFQGGKVNRWEYLMVMSILLTLPPLVLFFVAQRKYIQGIVISGVKG
jgi:multiple sugar transport system permease protein